MIMNNAFEAIINFMMKNYPLSFISELKNCGTYSVFLTASVKIQKNYSCKIEMVFFYLAFSHM